MCRFCDENSSDLRLFKDGIFKKWSLKPESLGMEYLKDDYVCHRICINYCPWCGRSLNGENG